MSRTTSTRRRLLAGAAGALAATVGSRGARAATKPRIVFVHGRGQGGRDPAELKRLWRSTLERGAKRIGRRLPEELAIDFPFYGDRLDDWVKRANVASFDAIARGEAQPDQEFLNFLHDVADQIRRDAGIPDAAVDDAYGPNPKERAAWNWEWVQAILRAIETGFPELTAKVLEAFVLDVFLYLRRVVVRDDINRLVRPDLVTGPTVVVGHSLGSIVAYEVLRALPPGPGVRLFVTVGSPLGLQVVRESLMRRFPSSVAAWRNAYDERDVVALRPVEARHFGGPIENFNKVRNKTGNHHGIDGYLDDPVVAGWILDALA